MIVVPGSHVFTGALLSYNGLDSEYVHQAIDHAKEYVRGNGQVPLIANLRFWLYHTHFNPADWRRMPNPRRRHQL
jgi:hypothetical protein